MIEAIGEGVSFTSLEHSAACDSLAVLRPRLPRAERAQALCRAFHYAGRPYDYNFDFATDSELVCLAVAQALLGCKSEARWLRFARAHLTGLFPDLPQRPVYNRRLRAALPLIKRVIRLLEADTDFWLDNV